MDVLASAAAVIIEPEVRSQERRTEIGDRLGPLMADGGPVVALQPIVDLATGDRVGAEALSRFPADWGMAPDVVFAEAHSIGLGHQLELLALERAAEHLDRVGGYIAMNVSPATLLTPECGELLGRLPLPAGAARAVRARPGRGLRRAERRARRRSGPRACGWPSTTSAPGFSSLRHIVVTSPDVIKIDRSIVTGLNCDPVLTKLVQSLVEFGHGCRVRVVAEGVETAGEAAALRTLGVDYGQGWHYGRPGPPEAPGARCSRSRVPAPARRAGTRVRRAPDGPSAGQRAAAGGSSPRTWPGPPGRSARRATPPAARWRSRR